MILLDSWDNDTSIFLRLIAKASEGVQIIRFSSTIIASIAYHVYFPRLGNFSLNSGV
ncbi:hypothetical protein X777_06295 [Ooceraea biroi]|uniref:Uncharacterized protein n=1 Tax=Ooceraea biroi TaxID=2015173 RepID=A0A026WC27_OOCBI|nr:hypothetical protein X777_06295 [Ooceraea biroi]